MRHPGVFAVLLASCAPQPVPWTAADATTWPLLRHALDVQRESRPTAPWAAGVRIAMKEPRTGRVIDGRGGIAVAPGRALRMILVGGAGGTMLDAWVTPERWRVSVPVIDLVRRGGRDEPGDLPIGFLRWWFFRPLAGSLFAATFTHPGALWLMRDGDAVIELRSGPCEEGARLVTTRRVRARSQKIDECRAGSTPRPGDRVSYEDQASGLRIDLLVESVPSTPPEADAFLDPDTPEGAR